ncbi:MAG: signal peptidase II [Spartobacteria bacterium]|nr:signal peptidase II [Spartobacteria bacterium]
MLALFTAMAITLLDQLTKVLIRQHVVIGDLHQAIPGFMNITYLRNPGAAWGMFSGQSLMLSVLSIAVLCIMVLFRKSFLNDTSLHRIALGLLAGGIIGNLIDRVKYGAVTDFIDLHIGMHHWPSFNVADSAICVGVTIYMITVWVAESKNKKAAS